MELVLNNLLEKKEILDGVQFIFKFDNMFGASVVRHKGSYGNNAGLWELAVIKFDNHGSWQIDTSTKITDDWYNVIGFLEPKEVESILKKINNLIPKKGE